MIAPRERVGISQKHTTFYDPEVIGKVASQFPEKLERDAEVMYRMQGVKVNRDMAIEFFRKNVATYMTKTGAKINNKWLERIIGIYDSYNTMNGTAYQVYNTLTHISTHVETSREGADVGRKQLRIEQDIDAVLKGAFNDLLLQAA
jgi:hypothetical protein